MNNRTAKYWLLFFSLSAFGNTMLYGQDIFQTKGGKVTIDIDFGSSSMLLQSNQLQVQLNYGNAELTALLDMNTLLNTSGKDLGHSAIEPIERISLKGKFGVDHIETKNHEPLQFEFSGVLIQNDKETPIHGAAELQHIGGGGDVSCLLAFNFIIDRSSLPQKILESNNIKEIKVQVLQTILRRDY